jgi:hypothetical protein
LGNGKGPPPQKKNELGIRKKAGPLRGGGEPGTVTPGATIGMLASLRRNPHTVECLNGLKNNKLHWGLGIVKTRAPHYCFL